MTITAYILSFLHQNPQILGLLLAVMVLFLEDTTIIAAGVLSASGEIAPWMAIFWLFCGILLGELGCYYIGHLAHHNKRLKKLMERQGMSNAVKWLHKNLILAVLAARYIPGMRVAIYGAMGFYRINIKWVLATSLAVIFVWAGGLFFAVRQFGVQYWEDLGSARWLVVLGFIAVLVTIYYTLQSKIRRTLESKMATKSATKKAK